MTALYALRHPETTWNRAQRYQGRLDAPLTVEGERQAAITARIFPSGTLDAVVSSPLRRAYTLAARIAEYTGAPVTTDERLTEIGQGGWENLYREEIERAFPAIYQQWYCDPALVTFPLGESLAQVRCRVMAAIDGMFRRWPAGNVAIVTHSVVIQVLTACTLHLDLRYIHRLRVSNTGITTICGGEVPGSLLAFNVTTALYPSPVDAAGIEGCADGQPRRMTT